MNEQVKSKLTFQRVISEQMLNDILITAVEGGSNYWYLLKDEACDILRKYKTLNNCPSERFLPAILADEKIPIHDIEEPDDEPLGYLSLENVKRGIITMIQDNRSEVDILFNEDADLDAYDADVIFQYLVMNEIVFG
jgi:hypothetical protein